MLEQMSTSQNQFKTGTEFDMNSTGMWGRYFDGKRRKRDLLKKEKERSFNPTDTERKGYSSSFFWPVMLSKPEGHSTVMTAKKISQNLFLKWIFAFKHDHSCCRMGGLQRDLSERPPSHKWHQVAILGWQCRQKDYYPDFVWELISEFHGSHAFLRWGNGSDNLHHLAKGQPQKTSTPRQDFRETVLRSFFCY